MKNMVFKTDTFIHLTNSKNMLTLLYKSWEIAANKAQNSFKTEFSFICASDTYLGGWGWGTQLSESLNVFLLSSNLGASDILHTCSGIMTTHYSQLTAVFMFHLVPLLVVDIYQKPGKSRLWPSHRHW